jgi:tetratricopeptide (TPR) repeat protein
MPLILAILLQLGSSPLPSQIGKIEKAVERLERHVESARNEPTEQSRKRSEGAAVSELDSLLTVVKKEISKNPTSGNLYYLKGRIFHSHSGAFAGVRFFGDSAESNYKEAIRLEPAHFQSHLGLANLYSASIESMPNSILEFRMAIACDSVLARKQCHIGLAYSYLMLGKIGIAELELEEHIKWNGKSEKSEAIQNMIELKKK